jgi:hypothetical protein
LELLDVSGNSIARLLDLRFLSLYKRLRVLKVGLIEAIPGVKVLEFAAYLCPTLETFDEVSCDGLDLDFDNDQVVQVLCSDSEQDLRRFLSEIETAEIQWDEPVFIEFASATESVSTREFEDRLSAIEERLPRIAERHPRSEQLIPELPREIPEIREIRQEIFALRQQITKVAELLYVHDRALGRIWDRAGGT